MKRNVVVVVKATVKTTLHLRQSKSDPSSWPWKNVRSETVP